MAAQPATDRELAVDRRDVRCGAARHGGAVAWPDIERRSTRQLGRGGLNPATLWRRRDLRSDRAVACPMRVEVALVELVAVELAALLAVEHRPVPSASLPRAGPPFGPYFFVAP